MEHKTRERLLPFPRKSLLSYLEEALACTQSLRINAAIQFWRPYSERPKSHLPRAMISGALLFFSERGYGSQEGCEEEAINVPGSGMVWDGVVYAPHGLIKVSGSNSVLEGRLIGEAIKVSGSNLEIGFFVE